MLARPVGAPGSYHRADDGLFLKALIPRPTRVSDKSAPSKLQTAVCFTVAVKELLSSDVRRKAASLLVLLLLFAHGRCQRPQRPEQLRRPRNFTARQFRATAYMPRFLGTGAGLCR